RAVRLRQCRGRIAHVVVQRLRDDVVESSELTADLHVRVQRPVYAGGERQVRFGVAERRAARDVEDGARKRRWGRGPRGGRARVLSQCREGEKNGKESAEENNRARTENHEATSDEWRRRKARYGRGGTSVRPSRQVAHQDSTADAAGRFDPAANYSCFSVLT